MIFVDTSAFVAFHRKNDQHHKEAARLWPTLVRPVVTSSHVIDELATGLGRAAGYRFAADCVGEIFTSPSINVVETFREDELGALRWMRKYADHDITFTDCVSFAIMTRLQIRTAFTFDRH